MRRRCPKCFLAQKSTSLQGGTCLWQWVQAGSRFSWTTMPQDSLTNEATFQKVSGRCGHCRQGCGRHPTHLQKAMHPQVYRIALFGVGFSNNSFLERT